MRFQVHTATPEILLEMSKKHFSRLENCSLRQFCATPDLVDSTFIQVLLNLGASMGEDGFYDIVFAKVEDANECFLFLGTLSSVLSDLKSIKNRS
jgi:hypothetical protein